MFEAKVIQGFNGPKVWEKQPRKQRNAEITITVTQADGEKREVVRKFKVTEEAFDHGAVWTEVLERSKESVSAEERARRHGLWIDKQEVLHEIHEAKSRRRGIRLGRGWLARE